MDMKLELVPIPVSDVDRAKAFYAEQLGFVVDVDVRPADGVRIVQVTPPGSACSIGMGTGIPVYEAPPGSVRGLHLVVDDIEKARAELAGRGVDIGEVQVAGPEGFRPATADDDLNNQGFAFFTDPDGNGWALQQITARS